MLVTSQYIQIAGFVKQALVDMAIDDYGGELDPHGADLVRSLTQLVVLTFLIVSLAWEPHWWSHVLEWLAYYRRQ